jgi:6-methylsalicylate decarboxylase
MNRFTKAGADGTGTENPVVDVHQHVWPAGFIEALRARRTAPCLREWSLELPGEPEFEVHPAWHDVDARVARAAEDGLDLALVSLSSPLGIESLAPDEAAELLEAYHDGVHALPAPFGAWAAACLTEIEPRALRRELERGFVGLELPDTELLDAAGYDHAGPLLEVLEDSGRPLLIHPGLVAAGEPDQPTWWAPLVPYVQQMHAAWYAFRLHGRRAHPRLRVCFAMLAGLARELDRGFVGLQLPATALLDGAGYDLAAPLLEVLEESDRPLLVHPGPVGYSGAGPDPGARRDPLAPRDPLARRDPVAPVDPAWWPAIVSYVQQMHAAWFAFRVHGRPRHPRLRVCFALLAGLAPLHGERFAARTGDRNIVDEDVFLDISSYGNRAVDATIRVLGIDALVNGSDRPYADPVNLDLGAAAAHALRTANPLRLLQPKKEVSDEMAVAACA